MALMDIMMSDLPRVEYKKPEDDDVWSDDIQQAAYEKTKQLQKSVSNGALSKLQIDKSALGKNITNILHR